MLQGTIHPDFTITGTWADLPFPGLDPESAAAELGFGPATLKILFDSSGGDEHTYLEAHDSDTGASHWIRLSTVPPPVTLTGVFGADPEVGCGYLEATDGRTYELQGTGVSEMILRTVPLSLQTYTGTVLFEPGDPMQVVGQVAPLLGSGCADSAIMTTEVTGSNP